MPSTDFTVTEQAKKPAACFTRNSCLLGNEAVCAECGKAFDKGEMIRHGEAWVCAACKPVFLQKLSEAVEPVTGAMRYAGFWIRFAAKFVDGIHHERFAPFAHDRHHGVDGNV
jgi:hypothetical protein